MKSKDAKKSRTETEVNNNDKEIDDIILAGSVTSAISSMEDTPADDWKLVRNIISMGTD